MKKHLLAFSVALLPLAASAQITITLADVAPIFTVIRQAQDTTPTVTPGSAGAAQTWNMSALNNHSVDTLTFTAPQFTPYGSQIPGCNYAIIQTSPIADSAFIYLKYSTTALELAGQASDPFGLGMPIVLGLSNFETLAPFAMNYGDTIVDDASGDVQFPLGFDPGIGFVIDSVRVHTRIHKHGSVDGWGNLTTPLGTFSTLRVNVLRSQIDTIDIYALGMWAPNFFSQMDSARTYQFWANGAGFPVAELSDDQDLGQITRATWLYATPQVIGIAENNNAAGMEAYPNPATDVITLAAANTAAVSARIFDISGREVNRVDLVGGKASVDVRSFAPGVYYFRAIDASGAATAQGKFIVTQR